MGPVHAGTGPTAALGQAANPNLGVSIIRRKRLRRGLCGLPNWFVDCGRRSAARKATASAGASGHRLVTFSLKALRCGSPGKTSRPDPALHGPSTGANLLIRRQRKQAVSNEWKWRSRIANSELLGRRNWCSSGATNCIGVGVQNCAGTHPLAGAEPATKSATDQERGGIDGGQHKASI